MYLNGETEIGYDYSYTTAWHTTYDECGNKESLYRTYTLKEGENVRWKLFNKTTQQTIIMDREDLDIWTVPTIECFPETQEIVLIGPRMSEAVDRMIKISYDGTVLASRDLNILGSSFERVEKGLYKYNNKKGECCLLDKDGRVINFKELWDKKTFSYQYLSPLNNITLFYYHKKEDNSKDAEVTFSFQNGDQIYAKVLLEDSRYQFYPYVTTENTEECYALDEKDRMLSPEEFIENLTKNPLVDRLDIEEKQTKENREEKRLAAKKRLNDQINIPTIETPEEQDHSFVSYDEKYGDCILHDKNNNTINLNSLWICSMTQNVFLTQVEVNDVQLTENKSLVGTVTFAIDGNVDEIYAKLLVEEGTPQFYPWITTNLLDGVYSLEKDNKRLSPKEFIEKLVSSEVVDELSCISYNESVEGYRKSYAAKNLLDSKIKEYQSTKVHKK